MLALRNSSRMVLFAALLSCITLSTAAANHLDELILFDQTNSAEKLDEGLVRQRLGLLNADGRPTLPLVALVSADGKRAAYDMTGGGANPTFDNRLIELKNDTGVLTLITHGNKGVIVMEQKKVKGFGAGTGTTEDCVEAALPVTTVRTNVTVNMVVCSADKSSVGVTSVASSLTTAMTAAGGSVSTMNASANPVEVVARLSVRARPGAGFTAAEVTAVGTAINAFNPGGRAFANQYRDLQTAIDAACPPDGQGSRIIAVIRYSAVVNGVTIQKSVDVGRHTDALEDIVRDVTEETCEDTCSTVSVTPASWSQVKHLYR